MISKVKSSLLVAAGLSLFILVGTIFYIKTSPIPETAAYLGSESCLDCHKDEHQQWQDSLHPKMMQKVSPSTASSTIKADLSPENPDLQFDPKQAVWVIGSKHEQQFMGFENETETLLPGAWLVSARPKSRYF